MSTQDVYSIEYWMVKTLGILCNAEAVQAITQHLNHLLTSTFCHLSGPQQALYQCELLVLLINNYRWNRSLQIPVKQQMNGTSGGQLKLKEARLLVWK